MPNDPAVFARWRARLKGEKTIAHESPEEADTGYYRKAVTQKGLNAQGQPNGRKVIIGWRPVAIYMHDGKMVGTIDGGRDRKMLTTQQVGMLWTYVVQHPIPYEVYKAVALDGQEWPEEFRAKRQVAKLDEPPAPAEVETAPKVEPQPEPVADSVPAAGREVTRSDNAPPEDLPLDRQHEEAIDNAVRAAADWLKPGAIKTEEQAAQAFGSKNRLAELRLAADKAGRALYEPMFREYQAVQKRWAPIVKKAVDQEDAVNKAVLTFREGERKRIAAEKAEADRVAAAAAAKAAEEAKAAEDAARRIADRAIAAGQPEPAPKVAAPEPAPAPEPKPEPAKPAPLKPTYGSRKPREQMKRFAVMADQDKVYEHFKDHADLTALLLKLAQQEVTAGRDVPGCTVREGLV